MNINNLFSSLQPAVAKIQEPMQPFFKIQEQMQAFNNTFYKFQKRFDSFPRQMLKTQQTMLSFSSLYNNEALIKLRQQLLGNGINSLSNVIGNNTLLDKCALYDITGNNDLLGMSSPMINILKKYNNILGSSNMLKSFDFKYTLGISSISKELQNITQTFYGLQFSTTIKKNNQTETQTTQTFYHETTISQAEHTKILSERDYYKEKAFYWQAEFQKENKERLQLQCITQTYNSTQSFKKSLSIQNSNNAKKKEYTELKKLIVEIVNTNSNILIIKTRSKKAREIEKIVKSNKQHYSNIIQTQISRVANLHDYIKEVLKKQV